MKIRIFPLLTGILLLVACSPDKPETAVTGPAGSRQQVQERLQSGWNTYHNPSVLSHVLMPEGFHLQFSFRKKRSGPYWLRDSYIAKAQFNFPEKIRPRDHTYDGRYTELEIEWEGLRAIVRTATDGDDLLMLFTPLETPELTPILVLESGFLWNKPGQITRQDGMLTARGRDRQVTVRTTAADTGEPLPLNAPYFSLDPTQELACYTGRQRSLEEVKTIIEANRLAHEAKLREFGELAEAYRAIQSVVAWNQIYDAHNDRVIASVSRIWNEAWAGYIIFDWDTYFIALMAALENKELAYSNALAITDAVTDRGFVPNVETPYLKSNDRSQPPVGSLICKMIYDRFGEQWFLEEVYDNLLSWNRWWPRYRDNQGFLSWGSDPHPQGMDPNRPKAARFESGLDNSPLFDDATFNPETHKYELASIGLTSLYIADCRNLADIADLLGKSDDAKELRSRASQYAARLEELWDEETGIYRDKNLASGKLSTRLAPTSFYPLIAGIPDQQRAERMVREHLLNPEEFFGEWMIPSIARNDPAYPDNSYWRGRIWAPMNFLVYLGLRNYDLPEARKLLAEKSRDLLLKSWLEKRHIYENYNADTGVGEDVRNSDPFYAWGGLLGLVALMEEGLFEM